MKKSVLSFVFLCMTVILNAQDLGFKLDEYGLCTIKGEFQVNPSIPAEKAASVFLREFLNVFENSTLVSAEGNHANYTVVHFFTKRPYPIPYYETLEFEIVFTEEGNNRFSYLIEFPAICVTKVTSENNRSVAALLKEYAALTARVESINSNESISKSEKKKQIKELNGDMEDIADLLTKSYKELQGKLEIISQQIS